MGLPQISSLNAHDEILPSRGRRRTKTKKENNSKTSKKKPPQLPYLGKTLPTVKGAKENNNNQGS